MIRKKLIVPPAELPMSLDDLKGRMRLNKDITIEDSELTAWLSAGLEEVENRTHRRLVSQTWELSCDGWTEVAEEIPYGVCQEIVSVKYIDENGDIQTVDSLEYGLIGSGTDYTTIHFLSSFNFPGTSEVPGSVMVQFVCGYGNAVDVPEQLKDAIAFYVMGIRNDDDVDMPLTAIIDQYRYMS